MTDEIPYWLILVGLFCLYEADYSLSSADLDDPFLQNRPLLQAPPYDGATLFETMTGEATGLNFTHPFEDSHPLSFLYYASSTCGGIAIGDINQDQRPDIFLAGAARPSALYEQDRTWHFTETTQMRLPTHANAWSTGAAMVDVDQDGDLDIYVCQYDSPNLLFLNQGPNEPMVEAANDFGLNLTDACMMPAFADYDRDGDLDVFILTYRYVRPGGRPTKPPIGISNGRPFVLPAFEKYYYLRQTGPSSYTADTAGRPDRLYRNNGDGTFTEVSQEAGITEAGHGLSATWWDYNADGWIDLYVANDFTDPDHLYRNNGDGTFSDVIAEVMPYTSWSSMGADCSDLNNDGLLDFMCADMAATTHFKRHLAMGEMGDRLWFLENAWPRQVSRNTVFVNTGTDQFLETGFFSGLSASDWTWAVKLGDYDNDGRVDVFTTNGSSRMFTDADHPISLAMMIGKTEEDLWKDQKAFRENNLAFRNLGSMQFEATGPAWGLDHLGMSYAAAHGDLDGDGDLDLIVANLDEPVSVYQNHAKGHRVLIDLVGKQSNTKGLGAIIKINSMGAGTQSRLVNPMTGFMSCNTTTTHFGLASDQTIDSLSVLWPSGITQHLGPLESNQHYTIAEPSDTHAIQEDVGPTLFKEQAEALGLQLAHREQAFDDRQRQPLIPAMHSRLGSGLAWGDANGDGLDDLYVGGPSGQPGSLFLQDGRGHFTKDTMNQVVFSAHRRHEDMAALWLDCEGDGDFDLLVTSGGVECNPGDPILQDRLYLNNGQGRLTVAPAGRMPSEASSSGCATAADVDGDGDLDLFIGGRVVPGNYPATPRSRLLINRQGTFEDLTEQWAPALREAGMVTTALWSDINLDGRIDLVIALEYGPVQLWLNQGTTLELASAGSAMQSHHGWWNALESADVDSDGDMDIIALNAGLNTKYGRPSSQAPIRLFAGPMDSSRRPRLIESYVYQQKLLPIRGLATASASMPWLREKFPSYRHFAEADLTQIYPQSYLDEAVQLKATHLSSGLWRNEGEGRFKWIEFPSAAQIAPGFGMVISDVNGDGQLDFFAAQNQYSREPETGIWRTGIGLAGSFDSQGRLELIPATQSGIIIPGDGKAMTLCDANQDGWPDLAVLQNNDRLLLLQQTRTHGTQPLCLKLQGMPGNPHAIGARVTLHTKEGPHRAHEIRAGSGYLSQSISSIYVKRPGAPFEITVQWPEGKETQHAFQTAASQSLEIIHPDLAP